MPDGAEQPCQIPTVRDWKRCVACVGVSISFIERDVTNTIAAHLSKKFLQTHEIGNSLLQYKARKSAKVCCRND